MNIYKCIVGILMMITSSSLRAQQVAITINLEEKKNSSTPILGPTSNENLFWVKPYDYFDGVQLINILSGEVVKEIKTFTFDGRNGRAASLIIPSTTENAKLVMYNYEPSIFEYDKEGEIENIYKTVLKHGVLSGNGKILVGGIKSKTVIVNTATGKTITAIKPEIKGEGEHAIISDDGRYIALAGNSLRVFEYQDTDEEYIQISQTHVRGLSVYNKIKFNKDGTKLLVLFHKNNKEKSSAIYAVYDSKFTVFETKDLSVTQSYDSFDGGIMISDITFSRDDKSAYLTQNAISDTDPNVVHFSFEENRVIGKYKWGTNSVKIYPISYHPKYLVGVCKGQLLFIDESMEPIQEIKPDIAAKAVAQDQGTFQVAKKTQPSYSTTSAAEKAFMQGQDYFGVNDYGNALVKFKEALSYVPDNYWANVLAAYTLCMMGDCDQSKPYAEMAFQEQLFNTEGSSVMQYYFISVGNETKAKAYMRDAIARNVSAEPVEFESDYQQLLSAGLSRTIIDHLREYFKTMYLSEISKRNTSWEAFLNAQKVTNQVTQFKAFDEVLTKERALKIPRYAVLGGALANQAQLLNFDGKYNQAAPLHDQAIVQLEKFMDIPILCQAYNNASEAYIKLAQYDKAIALTQKAIDVSSKFDVKEELARAYANRANAYAAIKEYNKAFNYLYYAKDIATEIENKQALAVINNNIGTLYSEKGQYESALKYFKVAVTHFKTVGDYYSEAYTTSNVAETLLRLGDSNSALRLYQDADKIFGNLSATYQRGRIGKQLGVLYALQGDFVAAQAAYTRALNYVGTTQQNALVAAIYAGLGNCAFAASQYQGAISNADKAININQKLAQGASEEVKRGLYSRNNDMYMLKTLSLFRSRDFEGAFSANERSRSQILREKLSPNAKVVSASEVIGLIGTNAALIDYNVFYRPEYYAESYFFPVVISSAGIEGTEFDDKGIRSEVTQKYKARLNQLRMDKSGARAYDSNTSRGFKVKKSTSSVQSTTQKTSQESIQGNELQYIIELYREFLKNNKGDQDEFRKDLAHILYQQLVKPIEPMLHGKKNLYIIPDGVLAFVPFETLINDEGKYLCEVYNIQYIQSASILHQLKQRNYSDARKPLIAFGNPVYEDVAEEEVSRYKRANGVSLQGYFDYAAANGESQRPTYIRMGISKWDKLPGTLVEVEQIGGIVSGAEIYTGDDASEAFVKNKDQQGELAKYKVIHFATHGFSFEPIPGMSAVILGQYPNAKSEDGYLQLAEIEKMNLKADLVTLSACQTGLGKIYTGEGVIGLTQAFLIAGANGMAVSLWSVSDAGTAKFMTEVYSAVYNEGESFSEAFTNVKRDFITGTYGTAFAHPSIWAPFVYYGR